MRYLVRCIAGKFLGCAFARFHPQRDEEGLITPTSPTRFVNTFSGSFHQIQNGFRGVKNVFKKTAFPKDGFRDFDMILFLYSTLLKTLN
jgi:hypothetical protein